MKLPVLLQSETSWDPRADLVPSLYVFECVELELALKLASGEDDPFDSDFSCPIRLHRGNVRWSLLLSRPVSTETVTGHSRAPWFGAQLCKASRVPWRQSPRCTWVQERLGVLPTF